MDGWRRVFAHGGAYQYNDMVTRTEYWWQPDTWREVPPSVAQAILPGNEHRLCDVTDAPDPDHHVCVINRPLTTADYATTVMEKPPRTTVMQPRKRKQKG